MDKLTDMEVDAIKEIANVGIGNAATSLSKLLNKKIEIELPDTRFVPINRFAEEVGQEDQTVISTYLSLSEDLEGECLFLFSKAGALKAINLMTSGDSTELGELEKSAFKEMSNIFTGSYIGSFAKMLDFKILPSVPYLIEDIPQSILDFLLVKLSITANTLLCVKTQIEVEGENINGQFIMMFNDASLKLILNRIHEKFHI